MADPMAENSAGSWAAYSADLWGIHWVALSAAKLAA